MSMLKILILISAVGMTTADFNTSLVNISSISHGNISCNESGNGNVELVAWYQPLFVLIACTAGMTSALVASKFTKVGIGLSVSIIIFQSILWIYTSRFYAHNTIIHILRYLILVI